ncbi:diguanylate cyclase domain-containing protein [Spirulina subsalsa]|uniref:diguanylate cyclase domain-containing protein n=1 Tax=Spirulina subsalsa TaxID=54311 RepID=UPI00031CA83B|nr:diguanylate cyclase [Spirulina subsalsa]
MTNLAGYTLGQRLYESPSTLIYRGVREADQWPVVLKFLTAQYPTVQELAGLRQEYTLSNQIDHERILKAYGLERYGNGYVLVLEDFGARSLHDLYQGQGMPLDEFFPVAQALVEALEVIHRVPMIHKDIKPSNILYNRERQVVKLADFGIAISLSQEQMSSINPNVLQGTLAYLSPEQTGRMNRWLDYRTDFYSLGVTFYELLSGRLPFTSRDAMELVHCHIAKTPPDLASLNPALPRSLCALVQTLMAKNAEDRYQSAAGLGFDLAACHHQWLTGGEIGDFRLKERDRTPQLLIPQKLYGREQEVASLLAAFDRVATLPPREEPPHPSELVLVAGYSGIGKTAIVQEVQKPIVAARGYFVAGKFDQFMRIVPYSALIQVFQDLTRQLLSETDEQLAQWRAKLTDALGENGILILDIIPELERIIGPQPEVPLLGMQETKNRFDRIFRQFIEVFCQPEHPLVIFLDDLQWVDSASLEMIELLITNPDSHYLLLIGAYRDNEVGPLHPLTQTVETLKTAGTVVNEITVQALSVASVGELLEDTLSGEIQPEQRRPLVELVHNKTQGNPFFLTQLLKTLYGEGLFRYDVARNVWQWDLAEIQAVGLTDLNILELMARNIHKLPEAGQKALKLAACIGNRFSLKGLATICQESPVKMAGILWAALQVGLILPMGGNYRILEVLDSSETKQLQDVAVDYRFLHDRVQQSAYGLIPEAEKQETHLRIGQLLLENIPPEERKDNVFAITNQLNIGRELLTDQGQRNQLAELNLWAGQRAKLNRAYDASENYLKLALDLLGGDSWLKEYPLTLEIYTNLIETQYFKGDFQAALAWIESTLPQTRTLLDKIPLYDLQIKIHIAKNELQLTLDLGLRVLQELGVDLVETIPTDFDLDQVLALPKMDDRLKQAAMDILGNIQPAAFILNTGFALPVVYTMIFLSWQHGNCPRSLQSYGLNGWLLCGPMNDIDRGYHFGKVAIELLDQLKAREFTAKIYSTYGASIGCWKMPIRDTIPFLEKAIKGGLETGDLEFACHAAIFFCEHPFFAGEALINVIKRQRFHLQLIENYKQEYQLNYLTIITQVALNLHQADSFHELMGELFDAELMLPLFLDTQNINSAFYTLFGQLILGYTFKQYDQAFEAGQNAWQYRAPIVALLVFSQYSFYFSLTLLARYPLKAEKTPSLAADLAVLQEHQNRLQGWQNHVPENYQNKCLLIEAEKARVEGRCVEAMDLYDQAIAQAQAAGFVQEEALGYERAGEFYLAWGREKIGRWYLTEAYYAYIRWGAIAKVRALETEYPQIFDPIRRQQRQVTSPQQTTSIITTSSNTNIIEQLDLPTMMAATQTISTEMVLSHLLDKFLRILMENAGANYGVLMLNSGEQITLEAVAHLNDEQLNIRQTIPLDIHQTLPQTILQYVRRTQETIVLDQAYRNGRFTEDPYIKQNQVCSVLCTAILYQGQLKGLIYLENRQLPETFTHERCLVLDLLTTQAAISITNAQLYEQVEHYAQTLEKKVQERTEQLTLKNAQLQGEIERRQAVEEALTEANAQLNRLASLDGLTQVANRRAFDAYLAQEWSEAQQTQQPIALILCDVDEFKAYNDTYGHVLGDRCLVDIAEVLQQQLPRPTGLVARYGGEEFALILPGFDSPAAIALTEQIQQALQSLSIPHEASTVSDAVTLSLGIAALIPPEGGAPSLLIEEADQALYRAKNQGRNQYQVS